MVDDLIFLDRKREKENLLNASDLAFLD